MIEIPSLRPETRYGIPTADQMLFNREYIVGYSYLFRQARWAMEVIDPNNKAVTVDRKDVFRADLRIPSQFRAELSDYVRSNHDRGHLISSADRRATAVENSETFLLSNMSPQKGNFNRKIWRVLEEEVRLLAFDFVEVYVICGPLFDIRKPIEVIGDKIHDGDKNDVVIPIPHAYFKSVLAENLKGKLVNWSFIMENKALTGPTTKYLVPTTEVEVRSGLTLWDRLRGKTLENMKRRPGSERAYRKAVDNGKKAFDTREQKRHELAEKLGLKKRGFATEFLSENEKLGDLLLELKEK